ncbi:GA14-synthase [Dothidotthia symphoricarpi CBS 119687]|uniref:GA14-synthase n=1 Tax=Dothidotthia symphoricarpi CBS 119687 TaxID=1392245 RepID=A0A6A6ADH8_9PLEO|nr:GA14-synthase [Dothidotthia symphoricarpi CBS 119687]KAF2129175.1 GA14-synthase [Dothidotthia symphoricarpi CBS 119687]
MFFNISYADSTCNDSQPPQTSLFSTILATCLIIIVYLVLYIEPPNLDLVNGKGAFELTDVRVKKDFVRNAYKIITDRLNSVPGKPFRVIADIGEVTILPPEYAHEIRNDVNFSFTKAAFQWFYSHLPGMEGFRAGTNESHIMKLVARHQLTHQLMRVTKAVSDECVAALQDIYTEHEDWHELVMREANLQVMARVTSRIFLGEELCRDPAWLRITSTYSVVAFRAVEELRLWPSWLRPVVQWFLPHCTAARALVQEARNVIDPVLVKRRIEKADAIARGENAEFNDAISWLEDLAQEKSIEYDPACAQLSLSTAALHSSTDFFTQVTLDIAKDSALIEALRTEIVSVLGKETWNKSSLYNLKLMDSVLKESQRLKPIAVASMRRYTEKDVTLSDGVKIPKNSLTLVSAHRHWDASHYENPNVFDGYRFLRMRQKPGLENKAQLVSVTPDHMGFGYGLHACPGRFFASEEIKIALAHMLMNYDLKIVEGCDLEPRRFGFSLLSNPTAKLAVRKRKEGLVL